jgi:DNA adenine methylase
MSAAAASAIALREPVSTPARARALRGLPRTDARPSHPTDELVARPFVKWAGGKWSLAHTIAEHLPKDLARRDYREPFVGGGAIYFWLHTHRRPKRAFLSDALPDLVAAYVAVRDEPEALIRKLERLQSRHDEAHYYRIRDRFNLERSAPPLERAAWLVYLNKTCYNGLFRTNRAGGFNVPHGRFADPTVVDPPRLRAASKALATALVEHQTFEHLEETARPGDVIYLDPPYVPLSRTASFAGYANGAFSLDDQARLAALFRKLDERGCLLALSNSDTPEVHALYRGFDVQTIVAPRSISRSGATRRPVTEVLVRNLRRW